jgi:uncharacterized protein (TIGR00251 family)
VCEIRETKEGIILNVRVIPRSSKSGLAGFHGNALKIKITSPPVEGKANEECIRFFADLFDIPIRNIAITGGATSRNKRISITGIKKSTAESIISKL